MSTITLKSGGGAGRVSKTGGDYGGGLIKGVSLVTRGEALGHGFWLDDVFLAQVTRAALLAKSDGLKARFAHPPFLSDSIGSVLGRFKHPHRSADGTRVLADLHLLKAAKDSPQGNLADYVLGLATEDPELFAASIVYEPDTGAEAAFRAEHTTRGQFKSPDRENAGNYPHARLAKLTGADLVDEPAANPGGLFATAGDGALVALSKNQNGVFPMETMTETRDFAGRALAREVQRAKNLAAGGDEHGVYTNPHGGYLVPVNVTSAIQSSLYRTGAILSRVRRIDLGGAPRGVIRIPLVDEVSRADGARHGGLSASWESETQELPLSRSRFSAVELNPKRLVVACAVTNEVAKYAPTLLGAVLEPQMTEELTFAMESAIVGGTGAAGRPTGVLDSASLVVVPGETSQAPGLVSANVRKMVTRLHPDCRGRAVWLASNDLTDAIFALGADYVSFTGGALRLLGIPVIFSEHCRAVGTLGDLLLVDLSQYALFTDPLEIVASPHVRFGNDETIIRAMWRCDGSPLWRSPVTPKHGTQTVSAFVALAARTGS